MKKILCLLCLAMMISLVGCGMAETKTETAEIADETPTEDTLPEESVGKAPASDTPAPNIQVSNKFGRAWSDVIYSESAELSKEDALALKAAIDTSRKIIPWEKNIICWDPDYEITINGILYGYSSEGTLNHYGGNRSLRLTEEANAEISRIITPYTDTFTWGAEYDPIVPETYDFEAYYVRTDGHSDGCYYQVFNNRDELEAYLFPNREFYDFTELEKALEKYDNAWFEVNKSLLLVPIENVSASVSFEVTKLSWGYININCIIPEELSDEQASWHIIVEPEPGWFAAIVFGYYYTENMTGIPTEQEMGDFPQEIRRP